MFYFDTSFLAPVILQEATSDKVEVFLRKLPQGQMYISHWVRVEFASLLSREVRMGGLKESEARTAIEQFEEMVVESYQVLVPTAVDYELARSYIQNFATQLRAGDALHLAIARNQGAQSVYTLDKGMLKAARMLKLVVNRGIRV